MNDHVRGADKITGSVVADEATQALLDRINGQLQTMGIATIKSLLPPRPRMLQIVCRMLAHKACAPEYENMLSNVAMLLALTSLVESHVLAQQDNQESGEAQVAAAIAAARVVLREGSFIESDGLQIGMGRAAGSGKQVVALIQQVKGAPVLSTMDTEEARNLATAILRNVDLIDEMNKAHSTGKAH
jgi:hypothetical protein